MLKNIASSAIVAVSDIERARRFYSETLGLALLDDSMGEVLAYQTGPTRLIVYRSSEAGSNRANAVVWGVGEEIDEIVQALKSQGVVFEHYDLGAGATLEGDLHVDGAMKMAWFKDPDSNILHINNM